FHAALQKRGLQLPQSMPLPVVATEGRKDVESILPKHVPPISIHLTGNGNIKVEIGVGQGEAEIYTLHRKSLEDFAAVLGSSIEGVVEWMAMFALGDPR